MISALRGATLAIAVAVGAAVAQACALEEDVALSRDTLNHYYPEALDVLSRIVEARRAGTIASPPALPPPLIIQRQMTEVMRLDRLISPVSKAQSLPAFALLQVETMLWSRLPAASAHVRLETHAHGPITGDLVVITNEEVVRDVVAGRLSMAGARDKGWLRLYGPASAVDRFMAALGDVGLKATASQ